ncbi:MAG: IS110 family transposase, partial [Candidatus Limnocylindria bacterium]
MNTVGIDIGKRQHVAAVCRADRLEAERKVLRFSAERAGLTELSAWMERQGECSRVAMESSGHYWMAPAAALHRTGLPVAIVNPLEAKYFGKSRLQRNKSDPADARTLAALRMRDRPTTREPLAGRRAARGGPLRHDLVTEQAKVCQRILRL